jgi:hypothetical protein
MMVFKRRNVEILAIATALLLSPSEAFVSVGQRQERNIGSSSSVPPVAKSSCFVDNSSQQCLLLHVGHGLEPPKSRTRLNLWNSGEDLEGTNRYKACVPYLLPLMDGDGFGKYIYERVPPLGFLDGLFIGPLYENFSQIPFLGLIIFVALTIGTRGNTDMERSVRFNAQQAALIDVSLVLPELIGSAFEGEDMPRYLAEPCMTFVWYTYMAAVLYSIFCNLRGKKPDQIPWISNYADMMVGPF